MTVTPGTPTAWFERGADTYERGRPGYPPAFLELLRELGILQAEREILDLAAGTGKLTRLLAAAGARVVAVEPGPAMRETFARVVPGIDCLDGTAERIPLPDAAVDAVTVAQAFHWFEPPAALAEIARVLRPGGALVLVWNERDETVGWVHELSRIMLWDRHMPYPVGKDFRPELDASGRFTPAERRTFRWEEEVDAARLVERVASTSYIGTMPAAEREEILARVREHVAGFPPRFPLPYVTNAFWCFRR